MPEPAQQQRWPRWLAVILAAATLAAIVRLAWLADDAYITLRTVEHLLDGHGLRWNAAERAQASTHPAWTFVLAAGRALTGEAFFTTIALGIAFTTAAVALLLRFGGTVAAAIAVSGCLLASRSFLTFATSGLENPLSYLTLAAFVAVVAGPREELVRLRRGSVLLGLASLSRVDLVVLCAPALLFAVRVRPFGAAVRAAWPGLVLPLGWLAFAAFYFGTPWPMPAYAKAIASGVPGDELLRQGLLYVQYVVMYDPATAAVVVAGIAVGLAVGRLQLRLVALGAACYCAYVVKVGGDFMGGRFWTPPFVVCVAILARSTATWRARDAALLAAAALAIASLAGLHPCLRSPTHDASGTGRVVFHGISDERLLYFGPQGLWSPQRSIPLPGVTSSEVLRKQLGRTRPIVVPYGVVGRYGFEAGDLVHICDSWLCDPLLMRLPAHRASQAHPHPDDPWHIGHFVRRIPEGYLETLATGENRIHHPGLRAYYETLRTAVRAPLLASERLAALWRLWRGDDDAGLHAFVAEQYDVPPRLAAARADFDPPLPAGTWWFDEPRVRLVYHGGLAIDFGAPTTARSLRVMLHPGTTYELRLRRGGASVATLAVDALMIPQIAGLTAFDLAVPSDAGAFDSVWVDGTMNAVQLPAIGGLVALP